MRKLFDEHRAQLGRPERVRVAHIAFLAPVADPGTRALERGEAQKALSEVRRAKDEYAFGRLAMKFSEDTRSRVAAGELPFMTREELGARLGPEAVEVAFLLQPGRVADKVIETERGFQIVKLLAHEAAREPSWEERLRLGGTNHVSRPITPLPSTRLLEAAPRVVACQRPRGPASALRGV